eukprot:scaffold253759_cov17-Prasinocladus_malaysianus.AAC.3
MNRPTTNHWKAIKRVLRYIKGTVDADLIYRRQYIASGAGSGEHQHRLRRRQLRDNAGGKVGQWTYPSDNRREYWPLVYHPEGYRPIYCRS